MLKQHRDTNCVFIIEEKCVKPQKEGRGNSSWTCVSLYEKVPEVAGLLRSCLVPGTVLSAKDPVPTFKDSDGAT